MIRYLLVIMLFICAFSMSALAYDPCHVARAATMINVPDPNDPMLQSKDPKEAAEARQQLADNSTYHAAAMARYDACNQSAAQAKPIP